MPSENTLFFHAPCFDGLVSAALAADYLETMAGWRRIALAGVTYDVKQRWIKDAPKTPFAVVDFLFHPRARFWADHHRTTFLTGTLRHAYMDRRKSRAYFFDAAAPSCSDLLWRRLESEFGYRAQRFAPMVAWASRIDAARYGSVDEVFDSSHPALVLNLALSQISDVRQFARLVEWLRRESLEEIAQRAFVTRRAAKARSLAEEGLARFKQRSWLDGDIVVFDVDAGKSLVSRYAPYRFYPDARYSAGIIRSAHGIKLTAMRNPWREFDSVPLGTIFRKFGGGGHRRVASVVLDRSNDADPKDILNRVVETIKQRDRASATSSST